MVSFEQAWLAPLIGLTIYISARCTMALGANLQRYSLKRELRKPEGERLSKRKQPLLKKGIALYVGSCIALSIALVFASPTLLSPCGTTIFIANAVFATWLNNEPFSWRVDGTLIGFIIAGTCMVIYGAPKENEDLTNEELQALLREASFVTYMIFLGSFILP